MPSIKGIAHVARHALVGATRYDIKLDIPPWIDAPEDALTARIQTAFKAMKAVSAPAWCRPAEFWQRHLDSAYKALNDGRLVEFLHNFGQWPIYTGIEETGYQAQRISLWLWRKHVEEVYFRAQMKVWLHYDRPIERLAFPRFGNQSGAIYKSKFIASGLLNDVIASQLESLVRGIERPVIAEIGGGYGKLAYCLLRDLPRFRYFDFDLPETLCTAAYYLGKCFPEKRMLLYGESGDFEYFDIILMPPWQIDKLKSADLFFNKNSLGEMSADTARTYIAHIARVTRGYFFHMNHEHERVDDGLLASEYEVPMRLVYRMPDIFHLVSKNDGRPDIFQYLYAAHTST